MRPRRKHLAGGIFRGMEASEPKPPSPVPLPWSRWHLTHDLGPFWLTYGRAVGNQVTYFSAHGRRSAIYGRWATACVRGRYVTVGYDR